MEPEINRNSTILGWVAASVFAVISLALLIMLVNTDSGDLSSVREQIREDCAATDDESRASCARALTQLEGILVDVREGIETPEDTTETEADTAPAQ